MKKKLEEIIENCSEPIIGKLSSVASKSLYDEVTFNDRKLLIRDKKEEFHSVMEKLLHISKRARPDKNTLVSYLTTRVKKSTNYNWYRLKRGLKWLKQTIDDVRIIGARGRRYDTVVD